MKRLRTLFTRAKIVKPKACRDDSFEIYLVGVGRKEGEQG
jgi:23S rRNA (uridine2552-2'-O)-methyltransferase